MKSEARDGDRLGPVIWLRHRLADSPDPAAPGLGGECFGHGRRLGDRSDNYRSLAAGAPGGTGPREWSVIAVCRVASSAWQEDPAGRPAAGSPGRGRAGARAGARLGIIIARPFGIPVYISPYWFLVAAVLVVLYSGSGALPGTVHGSVARYLVAVAFVVLLYLSVLIHELSHSLVARGSGCRCDGSCCIRSAASPRSSRSRRRRARNSWSRPPGRPCRCLLAGIGLGINALFARTACQGADRPR